MGSTHTGLIGVQQAFDRGLIDDSGDNPLGDSSILVSIAWVIAGSLDGALLLLCLGARTLQPGTGHQEYQANRQRVSTNIMTTPLFQQYPQLYTCCWLKGGKAANQAMANVQAFQTPRNTLSDASSSMGMILTWSISPH